MGLLLDRHGPLLGAALALVNLVVSAHVILNKRDARAAIGWVGLIWLVPGLGALIYAGFGVNRIRRRAIGLRRPPPGSTSTGTLRARPSQGDLVAGNRVTPLCNGEQAYPAMLGAIEGATASVCLNSFIFAPDVIGRRFVDALAAAVRRGVAVRVLVDAAGVRYSWPPIHRVLHRAGVPAARFLPITSGRGLAFFNLRNHRKILVADGRVAFCGGMNVRDRHVVGSGSRWPTRDVQFRLEGPVVGQVQEAFAEDWAFVTGEVLEGPAWHPPLADAGPIAARVLTGGPD